MPLLKKPFKENASQKNNSKFKVPFRNPLQNISNMIDNTINDSAGKKYNAFAEALTKDNGISSSPKTLLCVREGKENVYNNTKKGKKNNKEKINGKKLKRNIRDTEFSFDSKNSLSQEELNKDEVKAVYIDFMNKSLTKDNGSKNSSGDLCKESGTFSRVLRLDSKKDESMTNEKKGTSKNRSKSLIKKENGGETTNFKNKTPDHSSSFDTQSSAFQKNMKEKKTNKSKGKPKENAFSSETSNSFSEEILNTDEIKAAYIEFMNTSLANENKRSKKNFIIYSSSELFDELENSSKTSTNSLSQNEANQSKVTKKPRQKKKSQSNKKPKKQVRKSTKDNEEESNDDEFPGLTLEEKMDKIHESRNVGLYVICDTCNKARYRPDVVDPLDIPDKWYCYMNPDDKHNKCSDPEEIVEDSEFLINNLYNSGSIVFAKLGSFPWWPAMVEDDPDFEEYFWLKGSSRIPTHYQTTFFDSAAVTRAWIRPSMIKPFKKNLSTFKIPQKYRNRIIAAVKQAETASNMPLIDRLKTYSFSKRYKKPSKRASPAENAKVANKKT